MSFQYIKPTKEQRLKDRIERLKLKVKVRKEPTLAQLKNTVQRAINAYVRRRDADKPCISCQRYVEAKEAGHYIAQGASGFLRYNLDNLRGQCRSCNHFKRGNAIEYRIALAKEIGEDRVKWLEDHRKDIKRWTRDELLDIIKYAKTEK